MHHLAAQYHELKKAFDGGDLRKCGVLLSHLKVALIKAGLLVPQGEHNEHDLAIARDILEMGAYWSIRTRDIASFDRYFAQLQTFYTDYDSSLPPSPREFPLRGLNLIHLLTQNRIADFHTTLESLPSPSLPITSPLSTQPSHSFNAASPSSMPLPSLPEANPYIAHPVNLERWLMEGSYSKVWSAREEAPAEEYKFFVDSLMGTIRNEIASCEEMAYESLPLKDAQTLLFFPKRSDVILFAQHRGWQIDLVNAQIIFTRKSEEKVEIPKQKLIVASLGYARELEQIV